MAKKASNPLLPPKVEVKPLAALVPDQANPMGHPDANKAKVRHSLKQFGPGRSIVLDKNDVVYAGNCTAGEAAEAGITEVVIVEPQRHQLVAVRRSDWTPTEARAYSIADNKTAQAAEWDSKTLAQHFQAMPEAYRESTGFDAWEIEPYLRASWSPPEGTSPPSDDVKHPHSVSFTSDQWVVVIEAVTRLREAEACGDDDEINTSRAIELICADYLSGAALPEDEASEFEDE